MRIEQPVFLVGTMRSGSTILARCLGAHPLVHYAGFELSAEWSTLGGARMAGFGVSDPDCPRLVASDVTEQARSAIHSRFADLHAGRPGEVFFNKNPHLSNKLPYVREIFPDASLVVTSRDLRSTVASLKVHWQRMARDHGLERFLPLEPGVCWTCAPPRPPGHTDPARTFPGGDARVLAEYWLRTYEAIDSDLEGFERVVLVRHRDFVAAPHVVIEKIIEELGIPRRACELPCAIDRTRNRRWHQILSAEEQGKLDGWIATHHERIVRLRSADSTL